MSEKHKSKVKESEARRLKLEQENVKGFALPQLQNDPINDPFTKRIGKWTRGDPAIDSELQIRREYQRQAAAAGENAVGPLGELTADSSLLESLKEKKEQELYARELQLAQLLIDKNIPESQDRIFSIYSELKDYPDKEFANEVAKQEGLRILLRDGVIRGKEDHALLMNLAEVTTPIPLKPIWDEESNLIQEFDLFNNYTPDQINATYQKVAKHNSVFDPFKPKARDPPDFNDQDRAIMRQLKNIKIAILLRLYPGLREWYQKHPNFNRNLQIGDPYPAYIVNWYDQNFTTPISVITTQAVSNNLLEFGPQ